MHEGDVKRLAVGIEQKKINCGLIFENYVSRIHDEIKYVCGFYHLTNNQYEILLKETAERMQLPELLVEIKNSGILASYADDAIREVEKLMDGDVNYSEDDNYAFPYDLNDWPIDLRGEHEMQV